MESLRAGFLAPSTAASNKARWATIARFLGKFGLEPLPPSPDKALALGAALKAGSYRSAGGYLSLYRTVALRNGYVCSEATQQAIRDALRSCTRGLGGPVRARALPLELLGGLPGDPTPWTAGGPVGPRNMLICGAFWLLREIEVSTLRASLVELSVASDGLARVRLHLPASKTDQAALGVARSHGCACQPGRAASPHCPVHSVWDQLLLLRRRFPQRWALDRPDSQLPLFPTEGGTACAKQAVTATIVAAADMLSFPRAAPDGSERVSGHSLRATGAQGLAKAGLELWAIQLLGRWGSDAIKSYVRDAHLARSEEWARRALMGLSLYDVAAAAAPRVQEHRADGSPLAAALEHACQDLGLRPAAGQSDADLAQQLVEPVLLAADGEFLPPADLLVAERSGTDEELAKQEYGQAIIVMNVARGVAHRALPASLSGPQEQAAAACGWRFGAVADTTFPSISEVPQGHKALCGRCFPRWRAHRKLAASPGDNPPSHLAEREGAARVRAPA